MGKKEIPINEKEVRIVIKAVIANQLALFYNEELKYTPFYRHELKKTLNAVLPHLLKLEATGYDNLLDQVGEQLDYVHDAKLALIEEIARLEPPDYGDLINIIRAFKKNPKSLMGIALKILKSR